MKKAKKKIIIGLALIIFMLAGFNLFFHQPAKAQTQPAEIRLQIRVPGLSRECTQPQNLQSGEVTYCVKDYAEYLIYFYRYFVGVSGILATIMIIFAGFIWITAAGNTQRIEKAKTTMNGAAIGLFLVLVSFVLLNTISPQLVRMRFPFLTSVKKVLQSQYICEANPNITDKTTGQSVPPYNLSGEFVQKTDKEGKTVKLPRCGTVNPMKTELGAVGECMGTTCDVDGQLCYEDKTSHNMSCQTAGFVCNKTDTNECSDTDTLVKLAGETDKTLSNMACRKSKVSWDFDGCVLGPILKCEEYGAGWKRIECGNMGLKPPDDRKTACWDYNKPSVHKIPVNYTFKGFNTGIPAFGEYTYAACSDDPRAAAWADSICCQNRDQVRCLDSGKKGGSDEIQVDCAQYMPSCNNTEATKNKTCWITINLYWAIKTFF